ncbi:hypothetical protein AALP_AA2G129800 [Arabis alpina]|uniref:Uncharacterized protein n=1 Tax=Arabis alpina TaxID=50452 RepID=A0A087HH28_ARAAL|nr:hypothetical protein AALP_AA2G129800 [Arabis alpina]
MEPPSAGPVPSPEPPDPGLDAAQSFDSPHPPIPPEPPPIVSHVSRLRATVGFPRIVPNLDLQLMLVDCSSPLEFCGTSLWCVSMNKVLSCSSFASPTWESWWMVIEWKAQGLLVSAFYRLVLIVSGPLVTFIVLLVGTLIAICRLRSLIFGAMKFFSLSWWQIKPKELVNAIFPATGCSESKITNTSDLVLLKGSTGRPSFLSRPEPQSKQNEPSPPLLRRAHLLLLLKQTHPSSPEPHKAAPVDPFYSPRTNTPSHLRSFFPAPSTRSRPWKPPDPPPPPDLPPPSCYVLHIELGETNSHSMCLNPPLVETPISKCVII